MKEKDNKLALLAARLKALEKDTFEGSARLKKEAEDYKQQFHNISRKYRFLQSKIDAIPKTSAYKKPESPQILTIEELPSRPLQTSLSPSREMLIAATRAKLSQSRTQQRTWMTPTSRKAVPRPQSAPKMLETKSPAVKVAGKS